MGVQASHTAFPVGDDGKPLSVPWHRTKIPAEKFRELRRVSDVRGGLQTLGWLAMLGAWFALALDCHAKGLTGLTVAFVLLYGMQVNFAINGMHELGHGFVFKTKALNSLFLRVLSFLGWLHPDMFFSSHLRHHRFTQNAPHDQENPMPVLIRGADFLNFGFVNFKGCRAILRETFRAAFGVYPTGHLGWLPGWEAICYPPEHPERRGAARRWAQFLILGHLYVWALTVYHEWPLLVPLMVSFGPFYNGWLFWLCNSTQHVGLAHGDFDAGNVVNDFRLTTRTFYIGNPLVQFWYFHMNFHTEHHMYAQVPCYNLPALHEAIKHDLPPTPNGLVATWRRIAADVQRQAVEPTYAEPVVLPTPTTTGAAAFNAGDDDAEGAEDSGDKKND